MNVIKQKLTRNMFLMVLSTNIFCNVKAGVLDENQNKKKCLILDKNIIDIEYFKQHFQLEECSQSDIEWVKDLLKHYYIYAEVSINQLLKQYKNDNFEENYEEVQNRINTLRENSLLIYAGKMTDVLTLLNLYVNSKYTEGIHRNIIKLHSKFIKLKSNLSNILDEDLNNLNKN